VDHSGDAVYCSSHVVYRFLCQESRGSTEPSMTDTTAADEAARQAELEKQKEMERQKQLEEERLAAERAEQLKADAMARDMMMAKNRFLNENVYFDFDNATLDYQAQELLKQKAMWLRDNPDANVVIEGHCDERGTNAYNLALGERRAESAKTFLVNLGISGMRLTTISYGEEKPVDMGQNEEAWAKNQARRLCPGVSSFNSFVGCRPVLSNPIIRWTSANASRTVFPGRAPGAATQRILSVDSPNMQQSA
jgi:peptidoglycan-associated lipoprotein